MQTPQRTPPPTPNNLDNGKTPPPPAFKLGIVVVVGDLTMFCLTFLLFCIKHCNRGGNMEGNITLTQLFYTTVEYSAYLTVDLSNTFVME